MQLPPLPDTLTVRACVPEHSVALMQALSQGRAFIEGDYFFVAGDDWLMAMGYPLGRAPAASGARSGAKASDGAQMLQGCARAYGNEPFEQALQAALARTGATDCWAIGPELPARLQPHVVERDVFYVLAAHSPVPSALRGPVAKAMNLLRIEHSRTFTPEHRRLWAEFMGRKALKASVRELFARTPHILAGEDNGLCLLNAWDGQGQLAACLLMDYSAANFSSYILGAHSQSHYTPHAADALFAAMLEETRRRGQHFVHLGLGVNEGIARFKRKWGGVPLLPYVLASWQEQPARRHLSEDTGALLRILLTSSNNDMTKRQLLDSLPEQRPFAMLWEVEKNGKTSWLAGTAHFFCYSFEQSFRRLFKQVDTLLFEGPLDPQTLEIVDAAGKNPSTVYAADGPAYQFPLAGMLTEEEIQALERVVRGPEGFWPRLLNMEAKRKIDVRWYVQHTRPWCAMFTLWTGFLERQGWQQSVDLEAWYLGQELGKTVIGMESVEEQIASLDAVPPDRVITHFRHCRQWGKQVQNNVSAYLTGDLATMMGSSTEFPTRTGTIIGARDQRFRDRMMPFITEGRCVVFVGSAHLLNLREMLRKDGFSVRRCLPTWRHKIRARWRPYAYE